MEMKIVLLLAVVALSIGYCEAVDNIYGHEWENLYEKQELNNRLTYVFDPDAKEVARLLTKAKIKLEAIEASKGVTIIDLLSLTSRDITCRRASFAEFEKWRKLYSAADGNVYLFKYVRENSERLRKYCADHLDEVVKQEVPILRPPHSRLITEYIKRKGDASHPQDVIVQNFLAAKILNEKQQQELIKGCAKLELRVKESLSYFMNDDKKASDYLDNLGDFSEALVYKRCKVINQMFGEQ